VVAHKLLDAARHGDIVDCQHACGAGLSARVTRLRWMGMSGW
jgi:hypothetical protein